MSFDRLSNTMHRWVAELSLIAALVLSACGSRSDEQDDFVLIAAGDHLLGGDSAVMNPRHQVHLSSYSIARHEVTNREFERFVKATGYITDAEKRHDALVFEVGLREFDWNEDSTANWRYPNGISKGGITARSDHPVTTISFSDALAYCAWANVRPPTLDEWEVACRAGATSRYPWGDDPALIDRYANVWRNPLHKAVVTQDEFLYTSPVGHFEPNAWGIHDMVGNVFEFCSGQTAMLAGHPELCCARGGSWWCSAYACSFFNCEDIGRVHRHASFSNQGFRVVRNVAR